MVVAGVIQVGPLTALTRRHFEQSIEIMLWGPVNVALAVVDRMRTRGRGRVGIVNSIGGMIPVPHLLAHSTAKSGAVGFSSGFRSQLARSGIRVTTVVPGLMRTGPQLCPEFVGRHGAGFGWFSLGASLPLISMDAERAAACLVVSVQNIEHVTPHGRRSPAPGQSGTLISGGRSRGWCTEQQHCRFSVCSAWLPGSVVWERMRILCWIEQRKFMAMTTTRLFALIQRVLTLGFHPHEWNSVREMIVGSATMAPN